MSRNVSAAALRNSYAKRPSIWLNKWESDLSRYSNYAVKTLKILNLVERHCPFVISTSIHYGRGEASHTLRMKAPSLEYLAGGHALKRLKGGLTKFYPGEDFKLDMVFANKKIIDPNLIAYEIKELIERRQNSSWLISNYITRAESETDLLGLKIIISGRFKASARKQRAVYIVGRVPLQTISAPIEFASREIFGMYGKSTVKVWTVRGNA